MLDFMCEIALDKWTNLNIAIPKLTEEQAHTMLEHEMNNRRRRAFVERIHQRYTTLRAKREREDLLGEL